MGDVVITCTSNQACHIAIHIRRANMKCLLGTLEMILHVDILSIQYLHGVPVLW